MDPILIFNSIKWHWLIKLCNSYTITGLGKMKIRLELIFLLSCDIQSEHAGGDCQRTCWPVLHGWARLHRSNLSNRPEHSMKTLQFGELMKLSDHFNIPADNTKWNGEYTRVAKQGRTPARQRADFRVQECLLLCFRSHLHSLVV